LHGRGRQSRFVRRGCLDAAKNGGFVAIERRCPPGSAGRAMSGNGGPTKSCVARKRMTNFIKRGNYEEPKRELHAVDQDLFFRRGAADSGIIRGCRRRRPGCGRASGGAFRGRGLYIGNDQERRIHRSRCLQRHARVREPDAQGGQHQHRCRFLDQRGRQGVSRPFERCGRRSGRRHGRQHDCRLGWWRRVRRPGRQRCVRLYGIDRPL